MKNINIFKYIAATLLLGVVALPPSLAWAGSCCGGGAATTLVLPKYSHDMIDTSFELEKYNGFWLKNGDYRHDQPGTDLRQYRLNMGYAHRLSQRWQGSASLPYVWNDNSYSMTSTRSEGPGDAQFSMWYEALDAKVCRLGWNDLSLADLAPAVTLGISLVVPTGISPYDNLNSSFDITGRGFYRVDGNVLLDKSIFPFSFSLFMSYGTHLERPVDREYGTYVQPYRKKLGDRAVGTFSTSYNSHLDIGDTRSNMTYSIAVSEVWEDEATINGHRDSTSGLRKSSFAGTIAWSTLQRTWLLKATWNHSIAKDGWGSNTPASDIYSLGVTRVFK